MPTGYTAKLHDGGDQTFKEFAMQCARAFGACITMRDDSFDVEIPEKFEIDSYHMVSYNRTKNQRWRLTKIKPKTIEKRSVEYNTRNYNSYIQSKNDREKLKARYDKMLNKVRSWDPGSDFLNLKNFMIEQLESSIQWDCGYIPEKPKPLTPKQWYEQRYDMLTQHMAYHLKEYKNEVIKVNERNRWLRGLRESLNAISN